MARARAVDAILDGGGLDQIQWGVLIADVEDGRIFYERNARKKFVPASNQKILTAAAAWRALGPGYRWRTGVWALGALGPDGTLRGSLVVDAVGDPTWSERFYSTWREPLDALADSLRTAGVRRVTGPLVIDASRWDSTTVRPTWMVEDLPWESAATGGAFVVSEGVTQVRIRAARGLGRAASVTTDPALPAGRFQADIRTAAVDSVKLVGDYRTDGGQIMLGGVMPPGRRSSPGMALRDPVRVSSELFLNAVRERGIEVGGGLEYRWDRETELLPGCGAEHIANCANSREIAHLTSPPQSLVMRKLLEPSQNWIAEQIVRTLGAELGEEGSWDEGFSVVRETLMAEFGVDSADVDLRDGSGLSAYNLVTPRAMMRVLMGMARGPDAQEFRDALASPGEESSTLRARLRDLEGRLFAKTGTITHVNSLSGYVVQDNGRLAAFVILSNVSGMRSSDVRRALDDVVREIVTW